MQHDESTDPTPDLLAIARDLGPIVRAHAAESERERRLAKPVADALAASGLYRVAAPRSCGGFETDPRTQIEVIEAVSIADGASGWNLMIGIEIMGFVGAALPLDTAKRLFSDPALVMSGAANPLGRATIEAGGMRVSGQWPFASGCHNSQYFWGQCVVEVDGAPTLREATMPIADLEILDTWHVGGLRGTGSHDVRATDLFVPDEMTTAVMSGQTLRETGPLFRMHPAVRLAYNKVGVATGIARRAIDEFKQTAAAKTPRLSSKPLREKPIAQLALADAEATLRSARAWVFEAVEEIWQDVQAGRALTLEQRTLFQLACSNAASKAVDCVQALAPSLGTAANTAGHPFERCVRDVQVVRQHLMVSPQWSEAAGRVLLGLDSGSPLFM